MHFSRSIRLSILLLAVLSGFYGYQKTLVSFKPENVNSKDFLPDYLAARAVLAGVNPYAPLPDLNKRFQPENRKIALEHPSPHTPFMAVLFLPFAFSSYTQAVKFWLLIQLASLFTAVLFLFRGFKQSPNLVIVLVTTWALIGWSHVWEDLVWGQINSLLLLIIAGSWLSMHNGREATSGIMLGVAISLKLIFWPIIVFLLLCRRWSSAIAAIAAFAATNIMAAFILGWQVVANYYLEIGPSVGALYKSYSSNLSLWSIGWRLFSGTGTSTLNGIEAPPVFLSPGLAAPASLLLTSSTFVLGLMAAVKADRESRDRVGNFDSAYGIMICVCLLVSPLTWPHYLALMALPTVFIIKMLQNLRFPRRETLIFALSITLLLIGDFSLEAFTFSFSPFAAAFYRNPGIHPHMAVSFAVSLLRLIPTLSVLIMLWLMIHCGKVPANNPHRLTST